jgi:hypothetical protein
MPCVEERKETEELARSSDGIPEDRVSIPSKGNFAPFLHSVQIISRVHTVCYLMGAGDLSADNLPPPRT